MLHKGNMKCSVSTLDIFNQMNKQVNRSDVSSSNIQLPIVSCTLDENFILTMQKPTVLQTY